MASSASSRSAAFPAAVGFVLVLALALCRPALSVHLADHRYTVWGEVTYEDGTPASGVTVRLTVEDGASLGETRADSRGRYRVLLHVHNQDLHKVFEMHVNDVSRKVRILFNPADRVTERGQRVDFTVERGAEHTSSSAPEAGSTPISGRIGRGPSGAGAAGNAAA